MTTSKSRERFVTLAEKRVVKAIKDLRLIGNLSNRSNYSYTDKAVRKIINALNKEIKALKRRFENDKRTEDVTFKL